MGVSAIATAIVIPIITIKRFTVYPFVSRRSGRSKVDRDPARCFFAGPGRRDFAPWQL